jgi:hypothetical protein
MATLLIKSFVADFIMKIPKPSVSNINFGKPARTHNTVFIQCWLKSMI